jgi:NADH:ubiquinone oxidoreductase subunit F (NADH-binding)
MTITDTLADGTGRPGPATATTRRLLAAGAPDLAGHLHRNGPLPDRQPAGELIELVRAAALTGRGGAGFPTWRKLTAVAEAGTAGKPAMVIANGAEGEPGSSKDRVLMLTAPHLVLDGLALAAHATGATDTAIYVADPAAREAITRAAAERRSADERVHPRVAERIHPRVVAAPERFVSGQETAVVSAVAGGPALPRDQRLRVTESGVHGRPTLVQNVETLAQLALLTRRGPAWFRAWGTPDEPGSMLTTVNGAVARPGVHEVPLGMPIGDVLAVAGGPSAPVQAVLIGGYHGAWLASEVALGAPLSRAGLRPHGASPGAGMIMVLPVGMCGLVESARIASYLADQTAGQCGPCVLGLPNLARQLGMLAAGQCDRATLRRIAVAEQLVRGRGACHHPDGTAAFVASTMRTFTAEVAMHCAGRCSAVTARRSRPGRTPGRPA